MELAKIEQLLEAYFEGQTTLDQEIQLQEFFATEEVPEHLAMYRPMFEGFRLAGQEAAGFEIELPEEKKGNNFWFYRVAASAVIFLGIAGYFFAQPTGYTQEEQQALDAYNQVKQTMLLMSKNLNQGTASIQYLDAFNTGTESIGGLNEFTETKNRIFK